MPFHLKILVAPEGEAAGRKISLAEGENIVGRVAPPSTIVLEGTKVSKRHCVFRVAGADLSVEDLGSSNGLFVNGKRLDQAKLRKKDRLVVGEYTLEVGEG